jgi:hypothetical protein
MATGGDAKRLTRLTAQQFPIRCVERVTVMILSPIFPGKTGTAEFKRGHWGLQEASGVKEVGRNASRGLECAVDEKLRW